MQKGFAMPGMGKSGLTEDVSLKKGTTKVEMRMDGDEGPFTKEEFFEVYGGYHEWDAAAPDKGASGVHVDLKHVQEETRMDGDEGPFTKAEFFEVYGGYAEWDAAAPERRPSVLNEKVELKKVKEETRMDGDEGPFTKAEFFEVYGGYAEWDAAAPKSQAPAAKAAVPAKPAKEEMRMDGDEGPFTKAEFFEVYGGFTEWDAAAPTPPPAHAPTAKPPAAVAPAKPAPPPPAGAAGGNARKTCPICTFLNSPAATITCELCSSSLSGGGAPVAPAAASAPTAKPVAAVPAKPAKEELRMDGDEGPFTKAEFYEVYGGYAEWDAAEARMDGDEGPFTKAEFYEVYGGYDEWDAAAPAAASPAAAPPAAPKPVGGNAMADELKAKLEKKNADAAAAAAAALTAAAAPEGGKKEKAVPAEVAAAAGKKGITVKPTPTIIESKAADPSAKPRFAVGEVVEAKFDGGKSGKWYKGKVTLVRTLDGIAYDITYDDGDAEKDVKEALVRAPVAKASAGPSKKPSFAAARSATSRPHSAAANTGPGPGHSSGGRGHGALSKRPSFNAMASKGRGGAGMAKPHVSKVKPPEPAAKKSAVVAKPPVFKVDQAVEARYGGGSKYFKGKVTVVHTEGGNSYDVVYEDGDTEVQVKEVMLRKPMVSLAERQAKKKMAELESEATANDDDSSGYVAPSAADVLARARAMRASHSDLGSGAARGRGRGAGRPGARAGVESLDDVTWLSKKVHALRKRGTRTDSFTLRATIGDMWPFCLIACPASAASFAHSVLTMPPPFFPLSQEFKALEKDQSRSAARSRTEAALARRREEKEAQQAKMAALGIAMPSAEEIAERKMKLLKQRKYDAAVTIQNRWRCIKASAFIAVLINDARVAKKLDKAKRLQEAREAEAAEKKRVEAEQEAAERAALAQAVAAEEAKQARAEALEQARAAAAKAEEAAAAVKALTEAAEAAAAAAAAAEADAAAQEAEADALYASVASPGGPSSGAGSGGGGRRVTVRFDLKLPLGLGLDAAMAVDEVDPGGQAEAGGVQAGWTLRAVAGTTVNDEEALVAACQALGKGSGKAPFVFALPMAAAAAQSAPLSPARAPPRSPGGPTPAKANSTAIPAHWTPSSPSPNKARAAAPAAASRSPESPHVKFVDDQASAADARPVAATPSLAPSAAPSAAAPSGAAPAAAAAAAATGEEAGGMEAALLGAGIVAEVAARVAAHLRTEYEAGTASDLAELDADDIAETVAACELKKVSANRLLGAWRAAVGPEV